jgi:hypothetical protein
LSDPIVTQGFVELSRAFGRVNKEFPKDLRKELKHAAEPVARGAGVLVGQHTHVGVGKPWSQFRTAGGVKLVYVAPKQRGRKSRHDPRRRRPNLGDILLRGMELSLARNEDLIARRVERVLDNMQKKWDS